WNFTQGFLKNLTERLKLSVSFPEFEDRTTAQDALQEALKKGEFTIVWVDKAYLPYHKLGDSLHGYYNHQVAVYARDGRLWRLYIDDMSNQLIEIREKQFSSARASLSQNNFLMMVIHEIENINALELRGSIITGIKDCATRLTRPMRTIGISNLVNWSEKLLDRHDRLGWPQVFKNQSGLYSALRTVYESIKLNGTEGFALRKLYSDFLHEAAGFLNNAALNAIAGQYLQLSNHWSNLAENALPSKVPVFDQVKNLLNKKYKAYHESDFVTFEEVVADLYDLEGRIAADFPLNQTEVDGLYKRLASQIKLIAELEMSAALRLRDVTK
ncbi:MAG: DUF4872 domain-containing protein, partial [Anaerolineales bacterium]